MISPFLWFSDNAEDAVKFYVSLFDDAKIMGTSLYPEGSPGPAGSVMTVNFTLQGETFTALNGGPLYSFTPAISLFVDCASKEEVETKFNALSEGGSVLMPLQKYPFSECFGWCNDRFGVSWQLFLGTEPRRKIAPCLMFTGKQAGSAEAAMQMYTELFPDSGIDLVARYEKGELDTEGTVKHGRFHIGGRPFTCMDSTMPHPFAFTPATSFVIDAPTQNDVDRYWEALTKDGGNPGQCGWLEDKYGVSWQVVPEGLGDFIAGPDGAGATRAMQTMLSMQKLDIGKIKAAYEGA